MVKIGRLLRAILVLLTTLLYSSLSHDAHSGQANLEWDANTDNVAGYKAYYGTSSRNYSSVIDVGNQTTYTIPNLQDGTTYFFAVTAYNSSGVESGYSNEVSYTLSIACTYNISPVSRAVGSSGETGAVGVTAPAGCGWTAVSNVSWIIPTSNSSGTGNGTVNYSVAVNSSTTSRSGTMTIAGKIFTVTQGGAPSASCSYKISPTSQSFNYRGGKGKISVTSGKGCSWSASSNASWIAITSGSSGSGKGTVLFSVSRNSSPSSRSGTVTVAGQTFTITQGANRRR